MVKNNMSFIENVFTNQKAKEIVGLNNELKSIYVYNLFKKTKKKYYISNF